MSYEREAKVTNTWWIKIWVKDVLSGSLLTRGTMEDVGFMFVMACLAADCRGEYGWIQANPETSYTHKYIAARLNMNDEDFDRLLQIQIAEGRMKETDKGIFICNMEFYQRMKGVKDKKIDDKPVDKPAWKPEPISQTIQDAREKKQTAIGVVKQTQTAVNAMDELGIGSFNKATGEVLPVVRDDTIDRNSE